MTSDSRFPLSRRWTLRGALDVLASFALLIAASLFIWTTVARSVAQRPKPVLQVPTQPLSIARAPIKGSKSANVVMVAFSDFECQYCARFARETMVDLEKEFVVTGLAAIVYRHLPLESHRNARAAAETAACADRVGKFWELHDRFFREPGFLAPAGLADVKSALGLTGEPRFTQCSQTDGKTIVDDDVSEARRLGVRGTPAFFIGRRQSDDRVSVSRVIQGAQTLQTFVAALREAGAI